MNRLIAHTFFSQTQFLATFLTALLVKCLPASPVDIQDALGVSKIFAPQITLLLSTEGKTALGLLINGHTVLTTKDLAPEDPNAPVMVMRGIRHTVIKTNRSGKPVINTHKTWNTACPEDRRLGTPYAPHNAMPVGLLIPENAHFLFLTQPFQGIEDLTPRFLERSRPINAPEGFAFCFTDTIDTTQRATEDQHHLYKLALEPCYMGGVTIQDSGQPFEVTHGTNIQQNQSTHFLGGPFVSKDDQGAWRALGTIMGPILSLGSSAAQAHSAVSGSLSATNQLLIQPIKQSAYDTMSTTKQTQATHGNGRATIQRGLFGMPHYHPFCYPPMAPYTLYEDLKAAAAEQRKQNPK